MHNIKLPNIQTVLLPTVDLYIELQGAKTPKTCHGAKKPNEGWVTCCDSICHTTEEIQHEVIR